MSRILQPVGQKRHTNIAIVSFKKTTKTKQYSFEIACYPNKVLNFRQGLEKNIDEVIQIKTVFCDVGKGEVAHAKDLKAVFGSTDHMDCCLVILKEGQLQVSEKERVFFTDAKWNDIVTQVAQACMEAHSGNVISAKQVESGLKQANFHMKSKGGKKDDTKQQVREAIKTLEEKIPWKFSRFNMQLEVNSSSPELEDALAKIIAPRGKIVSVDSTTIQIICHPSVYRVIEEEKLGCQVKVIEQKVIGVPAVGAPPPPQKSEEVVENTKKEVKAAGLCCKGCGNVEFASSEEFRQHFKSEWHNLNKKRIFRGLLPLDHLEFEMMPERLRSDFMAVET